MATATKQTTMKAVVFHGPGNVKVEERPIPSIREATDALVKVRFTALCGSELHVFRGHQKSSTGFIMGHEFTGNVVEVGSEVRDFKVGDKVVCPFTTSCLNCFYCRQGFTSRCEKGQLFGSSGLDGAQAEYVRVALADGTLSRQPGDLKDEIAVLMADIWPTGYFAASNALRLFPRPAGASTSNPPSTGPVVVLLGCGPVGLCALLSLLSFPPPLLPSKVFAIDCNAARLQLAQTLGAAPLNFSLLPLLELKEQIFTATSRRGADAVIEAVGNPSALRMAYDLIRPAGVISSVGVHNAEIPFSAKEAYAKNVRICFGRCPVRAVFGEALEALRGAQDRLGFMSEKVMSLAEAEVGYGLFERGEVQKVIFDMEK